MNSLRARLVFVRRFAPCILLASGLSCGMTGGGSDSFLFVVNNIQGVTSYTPSTAENDTEPETELPAGAGTMIFQPRAILVTPINELFIGRQNGGITVHTNATTRTGSTAANRVVSGSNTKLTDPIAFHYDETNDRLYVGNISANDGILVFNNVSNSAFNGNIAPSRIFNPPDRAPSNVTPMTINGLAVDSDGEMYIADTSGLFVNSSRIVIIPNPGTASGETTVEAELTSGVWDVIEDIFIDSGNRLYVVDGSNKIYVHDNITSASGLIAPNRTITVPGSNVALRGIEIDASGRGFVSDSGNHRIVTYTNIASRDGSVNPTSELEGSNTELSTPRHMALFNPS